MHCRSRGLEQALRSRLRNAAPRPRLAMASKLNSPTTSVAIVNVSADGSVYLYKSTVDMGGRAPTPRLADRRRSARRHGGGCGVVRSRIPHQCLTIWARWARARLFHMGPRCGFAAEDARAKLRVLRHRGRAARRHQLSRRPKYSRNAMACKAGNVHRHRELCAELQVARSGDRTVGQCHAILDGRRRRRGGAKSIPKTGHVRILRLINAADCGKPIQPRHRAHAAFRCGDMQLGFTMSEAMHPRRRARSLTRRLLTTRFQGSATSRRWRTSFVAAEQHSGPFGRQGSRRVGHGSACPPAIANAIHDAVGVRITELPITAEAVLRALRVKDGRPLDDE